MVALGSDLLITERGSVLHKTTAIDSLLHRDFRRVTTPGGILSTAFANRISFNTVIPEAGDYRVAWDAVWSYDSASRDIRFEIVVDSVIIATYRIEPKDSADTGVTVARLDANGTVNSGTNQRYPLSGFDILPLAAGSKNLTMRFAGTNTGAEAVIYRAILSIERF